MARINQASLRAQLDDCRARFDAIKQKGEASADTLALIDALFLLVDIVVAVFLEKTTPKTSRNSSLPSSQDAAAGETQTAGSSGSRSRGPKAQHKRCDNLRTVTTTQTSPVTACRRCGHDLSRTPCSGHEQRIEVDIVFETVERRITAEIKNCPRCRTRTRGRFPDSMQGPLQYGPGIAAYVVHLLCAQLVSLKRTAAMIQAMTGRLLSEATLLGFVSRLHQALEPWEAAAIEKLMHIPVLHVDETSLRVNRPATPSERPSTASTQAPNRQQLEQPGEQLPQRVKFPPSRDMMDQVAVEPAIAILKRMDVDEAECEYRRRDDRIKLQRHLPVERNHPFYKPAQVFRSSNDVLGNRHMCFTIMFPDKAVLTSQSETDEAGIPDDNALLAQQFV